MIKLVVGVSIGLLIVLSGKPIYAQSLNLVGNKVTTLIDDQAQPARLFRVVEEAFSNRTISLTATTQAWSGSGLRSGKYQGYVDHYSLDIPKNNFLYSQPYVHIDLHAASLDDAAKNIVRLEQLFDERIGIEKRFANTDQMRQIRDAKWARASNQYENIQQLAQQRVNIILADKVLLQEMNKLLKAIDEDPLVISPKPLFTVHVQLGINKNVEQAQALIAEFDQQVARLTASDRIQELYIPQPNDDSLLDSALYKDILRKW